MSRGLPGLTGETGPPGKDGGDIHRWQRAAAYIAIVVLTAGGFAVVQHQSTAGLKQAQREDAIRTKSNSLESCERGNILRKVEQRNANVLKDFLETAREARQASADTFKTQGNMVQYRINQDAADHYEAQLRRLVPVPQVVCKDVIR